MGLSSEEPVSIVLEGDGTQVDDGEYFQTLPENSIYMFLRSGESWHPTGSDSIKAGTFFSKTRQIDNSLILAFSINFCPKKSDLPGYAV